MNINWQAKNCCYTNIKKHENELELMFFSIQENIKMLFSKKAHYLFFLSKTPTLYSKIIRIIKANNILDFLIISIHLSTTELNILSSFGITIPVEKLLNLYYLS
ncbi:MAG: hypothetical protein RSE00_05955 [Clostridia bacterium]